LSPKLPLPIQALFDVNPLTYVANAVRDGYSGVFSSGHAYQMLLLFAETVVVLVLATRAYMRSSVSFE
jgi:ABC-type polysaccharide/polyol phosphate export permease